jgi:predicted dinucleotide-utilizing enzyme
MSVKVSFALSLAGVGPDRTRVRMIAVSGGRLNEQWVEVRGELGRLTIEAENVPSATNRRTVLLSIYSSIAFLAESTRRGKARGRTRNISNRRLRRYSGMSLLGQPAKFA